MTNLSQRDLVRRLRGPAYLFLAVTFVFQVADYLVGLLPPQIGSAAWRFASVGMGANMVGNLLLLLLLAYAVALWFNDRGVLAAISIIAALGAVALLAGLATFALDAIQLRPAIAANAKQAFDRAAVMAAVKLLVETTIAAIFAISSLRALLALRRDDGKRQTVVGLPLSRASQV